MPGRRTSIAARASSRWTESDRAALERARTRVHARYVAEGANSRLATSRDRTDGASPSSRAPTIFRHTVREAFGEWLPERRALLRARENQPPANATTVPDVSVATLAKVRAWVRAWRAKTKASAPSRLVRLPEDGVQGRTKTFVVVAGGLPSHGSWRLPSGSRAPSHDRGSEREGGESVTHVSEGKWKRRRAKRRAARSRVPSSRTQRR